MPLSSRRFWSAALVVLSCSGLAAQPSRDAAKDAVRDPRGAASRTAKGPLPDPALLDGSTLEAEKRPEHGMLGEFEMPGDENAKSDRVGKSSEQPPPQGGGGGGQKSQDAAKSGGAPSGGGGAASQSQQSSEGSQGGGGSAGAENQAQSAQNAGGAGGKSDSQGGPSGSADGTQVASISGAAGQAGSAPSTKPQQVSLGDSAMQIKQQGGAAPNVVGAQQLPQGKDVPQQYDGKTPSGGKQSGAGRGNQGVEKGRVMPAGI
jgi:hypothetical protein